MAFYDVVKVVSVVNVRLFLRSYEGRHVGITLPMMLYQTGALNSHRRCAKNLLN